MTLDMNTIHCHGNNRKCNCLSAFMLFHSEKLLFFLILAPSFIFQKITLFTMNAIYGNNLNLYGLSAFTLFRSEKLLFFNTGSQFHITRISHNTGVSTVFQACLPVHTLYINQRKISTKTKNKTLKLLFFKNNTHLKLLRQNNPNCIDTS